MLGVARSASGRRWSWRPLPSRRAGADRIALALGDGLVLPEIVGRLLAGRGLDPAHAPDFLAPTLRRLLPDPSVLLDMDRAAARLADAVRRGETIGVFGDYDVDGACSAALLAGVLRRLGCRVAVHIPDRVAEGYGPNREAIGRLAADGATLVIAADCGAAAGAVLEPLAHALDIVVLDHHRTLAPPRGLVACVDPNRPDDVSGLGHLCAAAVAFLALVATLRELRRGGLLGAGEGPDLRDELDLVALATICDVVPLVGVNRAFVSAGLQVLGRRRRPGLAALLDLACGVRPVDGATCGYALGPRINAGGRLGDPSLGVRLLLADDPDEARRIATALDEVNGRRRSVEASVLDAAVGAAAEQVGRGHATIVLEGEGWHPGVVGIVASRLRERFNRPSCVGAAGDGRIKGSGRSVGGLDLGGAIVEARAHGLLDTGGGHAMAAGYGYGHEGGRRRAALHDFLDGRLAAAAGRSGREDLVVEGVLAAGGATLDLARALRRLAPFGAGNAEPVFALNRVRVRRADRVGRDARTVRVLAEGEDGARVKAMLFRAEDDHPLAPLLLHGGPRPLHLAGALRADHFGGEEQVSFVIEDAAPAT